mgnify:CR=1 FL=1
MGRAIDMEKDIGVLKLKLEKLENTVRGMTSKLDELDDAVFEYEEKDTVKKETKEKEDGKKKANDKGNRSKSKSSDSKNRDTKNKNDKSGDSSK